MKNTKEELVWQGIELSVYRQTVTVKGENLIFERVVRPDGTRTIAIDEKNQILLTSEYRRELGKKDWRIPGGKLSDWNEPPIDAAKREFQEETGYTANQWQYLWSSTPHATVRYQRHFFLATELIQGSPNQGVDEDISIHWIPFHKSVEMALDGSISEEISALSILRLDYQIKNGILSPNFIHFP